VKENDILVSAYTLPEDRLYHIGFHIWLMHSGERVRIGLIEQAADLAGTFIDFVPRAIGQTVYKGRTCATLESDVWVGPVKAPCGGEIIELNESLFEQPGLINQSPYEQGWLMTLRPIDWGLDQVDLLTPDHARRKLETSFPSNSLD
jgi:glycine cleavage system H protein